MSIFSWLGSLRKPPINAPKNPRPAAVLLDRKENTWLRCTHDYTTDFISDSFDEVMVTVEMDPLTCGKLKQAIISTFNDSPRERRQATFIAVHGSSWSWPALREWREYFTQRGAFPLSWEEWLEAQDNPSTLTFQEVCDYVRKEELRNFLEAQGIEVPLKIKKAEMVRLGESLEIERLRPLFTPDKWIEVAVRRQNKSEDETLALLVNTIWSRAAGMRNYRWCPLATGRKTTSPGTHDAISDDPVGQTFCEQWQTGKLIGFPPFFPGDRTTLLRKKHPV